jgi:hypothetical protein
MRFGYTILYVEDVSRAIEFYERAFGLARRFVSDDATYGEMETGDTMTRRSCRSASRSASSRMMFPLPGMPRSRPGRSSSPRLRPNRGGKPSPTCATWRGCSSKSARPLQARSIVR